MMMMVMMMMMMMKGVGLRENYPKHRCMGKYIYFSEVESELNTSSTLRGPSSYAHLVGTALVLNSVLYYRSFHFSEDGENPNIPGGNSGLPPTNQCLSPPGF